MSRPRNRKKSSLRIEQLEARKLMAADLGLHNEVLAIHGTSQNDHVEVRYEEANRNSIQVTINGHSNVFRSSEIKQIEFNGLAGDDFFRNQTPIRSVADGGAGNDVLIGGRGADDLSGGAGDDLLDGGRGRDILRDTAGRNRFENGEFIVRFNQAPTLELIPDQVVGEGESLVIDLRARDKEGDRLKFSANIVPLQTFAPTDSVDVKVDGSRLTIRGLSAGFSASIIQVRVTDGQATAEQEFSVSVRPGRIVICPIDLPGDLHDGPEMVINPIDVVGSGTSTVDPGSPIPAGPNSSPTTTQSNGTVLIPATPAPVVTATPAPVTAAVVNGVLTITGTANGDNVAVSETATDVVVSTSGATTLFSKGTLPVTSIHFKGGAGDDVFNNYTSLASLIEGEAGTDSLFGGSGADQLFGGDDNDLLAGGGGNDGLIGGKGTDTLVGGFGADRFLTQTGDTVSDLAAEDAEVQFVDGTNRPWSDDELKLVDGAFKVLVERTGNTHLLKDPVTSVPITFERIDVIPSDKPGTVTLGDNADPVQRSTEYAFENGNWVEVVNDRTPRRVIRMTDAGMSGDAQGTVLHEIGHNWDSAKEIGRVLPSLEGVWDVLERIHRDATAANDPTQFVSSYAATDSQEDFAETFAEVLKKTVHTANYIVQRYDQIDSILNALTTKAVWDGRPDDMHYGPSEWQQIKDFFSSLDPSKQIADAFKDFFRQLDPSQWKFAMPNFSSEMFAAIVPDLDPSKLRDVLPNLAGDTLQSVAANMSINQIWETLSGLDPSATREMLDHFDSGRLADALGHVNLDTLTAALNNMSVSKLASVLQSTGVGSLHGWLEQVSDSRIVDVLRHLNSDTLAAALNNMSASKLVGVLQNTGVSALSGRLEQVSASRIADVLGHVNNATLAAALNNMSVSKLASVLESTGASSLDNWLGHLPDSRVADALERVNGDTLTAALDAMSTRRIADVIEKVDGDTLNASLKRLSNSRVANVLEKVNGDTLKASLKRLSDSRVANVLEKVDGDTLKASLKRLSDSRVANVLEKVDGGTFKAALKRLSAAKLKNVLPKLDSDVRSAATKYLKKVDPGKLSGVVDSAEDAVESIGDALGL